MVDHGVPATEEIREEQLDTGDPGVPSTPVPDSTWASEDHATTVREQREGESLTGRLNRERPERDAPAEAGERILEPGAEEGLADLEPDVVGESDAAPADTLSSEEAAVTIREDPGGLTET